MRDRQRGDRPKSFQRWQRLTLLAQGPMPEYVLLEDVYDLTDFLEATGRTIPRTKWADESIAALSAQEVDGLF